MQGHAMLNFTEKTKEFQKLSDVRRKEYVLDLKENVSSQMKHLESGVADAKLRTDMFNFLIGQSYFLRYLNFFKQFELKKAVYVSSEYRYINLQTIFSCDGSQYTLDDFFWIEVLDKICKLGLKRHLTDIPSEAFTCLLTHKKSEALAHSHLDHYSFKMNGPRSKLNGITLLDFDETGQFHWTLD